MKNLCCISVGMRSASVVATISTALLGLTACAAGEPSPANQETTAEAPAPTATPDDREAEVDHAPGTRVGGDMAIQVTREGDIWRSGDQFINTPLPRGYPAPTPMGAIEIKEYPLVRRAQVKRDGNPDWGMGWAFWPLFQHIKQREIAMTSPVEMDFEGMTGAPSSKPDSWTMSFLYRAPELGPTGADKKVEVVDIEPVTVVAIGFKGSYKLSRVREHLGTLENWLNGQNEWEPVGEPRALYYNGPEQRESRKWGEVQIPITRLTPTEAGSSASGDGTSAAR